ncbi:hypothetical protein [Polaromonas sp. P5_D5]
MKKPFSVLLAGLLFAFWGGSISCAAAKNPSPLMPIADKAQIGPDPQRRAIVCNTAASPQWCWGDFIIHCGHSKGVISTNPDGTITCTIN